MSGWVLLATDAPKDPLAFRITPPGTREPLWLVIALGVDAPPAIRRIAHAQPTVEDRAALEAALEESESQQFARPDFSVAPRV